MKLNNVKNWSVYFALFSLFLGVFLRLYWMADMPYDGDQKWTMQRVMNWGLTEPFPMIGMGSSVGVPNPGFSIWGFLLLGEIFGRNPLGVVTGVIFLNFFSLFVLFLNALKKYTGREREMWMWCVAFSSVNPLAFHFSRDIWAQSLLPFFVSILMLSWTDRSRKTGAFFLGFVGLILGQIHLGGFFVFLSLVVFTFIFDQISKKKKIHFLSLASGIGLSSLGLIPWILFKMRMEPTSIASKFLFHEAAYKLKNLIIPRIWLEDSLGLSLHYTLGHHFQSFLSLPHLWGRETFLVQGSHFLIGIIFIVCLLSFFSFWIKMKIKISLKKIESFSPFITLFLVFFISGCVAMTLGPFLFYRHYLLNLYPILFGFLAILIGFNSYRYIKFLGGILWLLQLFITLNFIYYINIHGGADQADYKVSYSRQLQLQKEHLWNEKNKKNEIKIETQNIK